MTGGEGIVLKGLTAFVLAAAGAVVTGCGAAWCYSRLPAGWLCEVGERPGPAHGAEFRRQKTRRRRVPGTLLAGVWLALYFSGRRAAAGAGRCGMLNALVQAPGVSGAAGREAWIAGMEAWNKPGWEAAWAACIGLLCAFLLLMIAFSDLDYRIIPDQLTAALLLPALLRIAGRAAQGMQAAQTARGVRAALTMDACFAEWGRSLLSALEGGILPGGLMLLGAVLSAWWTGTEGVGFGDVKLMAACGVLAGREGAWMVYVITILSSAAFFAGGMIAGKFRPGEARPLAPWIAGAAMIVLLE